MMSTYYKQEHHYKSIHVYTHKQIVEDGTQKAEGKWGGGKKKTKKKKKQDMSTGKA